MGDGETFYTETLRYVENIRAAGVPAEVDVFHTDMHAFDMLRPEDERYIDPAAYTKEMNDLQLAANALEEEREKDSVMS